jgi:hypothetical protein
LLVAVSFRDEFVNQVIKAPSFADVLSAQFRVFVRSEFAEGFVSQKAKGEFSRIVLLYSIRD